MPLNKVHYIRFPTWPQGHITFLWYVIGTYGFGRIFELLLMVKIAHFSHPIHGNRPFYRTGSHLLLWNLYKRRRKLVPGMCARRHKDAVWKLFKCYVAPSMRMSKKHIIISKEFQNFYYYIFFFCFIKIELKT